MPEYSLRQRELFVQKSTRVAASYLRRTEELGDIPQAMKPFLDVLRRVFVDLEDVSRSQGMKTVGTYCVMLPSELIWAAGAMPVRLCSGSYTAYTIGDDLVPRDACPLVKSVMGFGEIEVSPLYSNCSLMVIPVTCDCKKKLAGMLERLKPTVTLHVPSSKERDADMEEYVRELYRLIPILEEVTGRQVTPQSLAEAINQKDYAQYEMSRFLTYRQHNPPLLHGTQVMAVMNAFAYMPPLEWAKCMRQLNDELEERLKQKKFAAKANRPRILVTGSPILYPNLKIPLLIEEMGGMLVGDETCMGERALYDPLTVTDRSFDGMMRALAGRYTRPCTCPTFTENRQRIFRIKQMIKDHQIQGVIYHVLRGCLVYDYEYPVLEEELEKEGIPIIRVESDYNEEDVEQLRIRIEAFIELLKLKQFSEQKARGTV
ncbi:MAG: 2-hydroxyacyl-CoA dehydratase [Lawsonibacter sp.]|jgi:benzoyl-CoA reductase/2-hydroxyglutaryl-CoA dehydratase subunit BcrC/BadD/HgdB|nr:2-hydroxyacyl-CoA dehydratase [Lawsonibacter sp.]